MDRPAGKSWSTDLTWSNLDDQTRVDLIDRISPVDGKYRVESGSSISATTLSFYPERVRLLRLCYSAWAGSPTLYYLEDQGNLFRLNGTSPPIHEVNAKAPINLSEANVLDYLRFFCFFVRGDEGPWLFFESLADSDIPDIPDEDERIKLEKHVYPSKFIGSDEEGNFHAAAMIWYSNAIFAAKFKVQPTGMIEMEKDEQVLSNLSVKISARIS